MYFITFSEMLGSNGDQIAKGVAQSLNYSFVGEEELYKTASGLGYLSDVQKLDEKGPSLLGRLFSERPKIYLDRLQSVLFEIAQRGDAVFVGRGSQLLLSSFGCALHVLVTGSMEKRIQRVMEERRVNREVAEKMIQQSDHDKRAFIRFAHDEDWLNPKFYDVTLNTDKLSVESAVKIVIDSARSEEIKACGVDSMKELAKLSLQRKVESGLLEAGVMSSHLFVTVDDVDTVRLYGIASSAEEKETVARVAKSVKGVTKFTNDVQVMPMTGA